ncbi:PleD family two-component system response regulator [candidate division KSB1 bacterium]
MKTILVVDDDQGIREILSSIIEKRTEHKVLVAEDGEAALEIARKNKIDLFILDMLMPRIGGIALFNDLQRSFRTKDTPVIFISGTLKDEEFQREGVEMGAVDYITKPIDMSLFIDKINEVIGSK